ncbi:MAG TPA: DUF4258 domain-containing protein [Candidatus Hypogeohydataceae bacterium YC40]
MLNTQISAHARFEMERRQIPESLVCEVALSPQQILLARKGRKVYQSKFIDPIQDKEMLLRVVTIESGNDLHVVTVYKTSKVEKYWQKGR